MEIYEIREKFNNILYSKNINENREFITKYIPEAAYMIGFEHNHPYHYLNVWDHTAEVVKNIEGNDLETVMSAFLHDMGKPFSYQDGDEVRHFYGHPKVSKEISEKILNRLQYDENFKKNVLYLVETHDTEIDEENLDNTYKMILKRINLQYADIKAHTAFTVKKRVENLDKKKAHIDKMFKNER